MVEILEGLVLEEPVLGFSFSWVVLFEGAQLDKILVARLGVEFRVKAVLPWEAFYSHQPKDQVRQVL